MRPQFTSDKGVIDEKRARRRSGALYHRVCDSGKSRRSGKAGDGSRDDDSIVYLERDRGSRVVDDDRPSRHRRTARHRGRGLPRVARGFDAIHARNRLPFSRVRSVSVSEEMSVRRISCRCIHEPEADRVCIGCVAEVLDVCSGLECPFVVSELDSVDVTYQRHSSGRRRSGVKTDHPDVRIVRNRAGLKDRTA